MYVSVDMSKHVTNVYHKLKLELQNMKQALHDIVVNMNVSDDDLALLTCYDILEIVMMYKKFDTENIDNQWEVVSKFVNMYLEAPQVPMRQKINVIVMGAMEHKYFRLYININDYKPYVIEALKTLHTCTHVIEMISTGILQLSYDDLTCVPLEFVIDMIESPHLFMNKVINCKTISEDSDEYININVHPLEKMFVNCFDIFFEAFQHRDKKRLYECYSYACHPKLMHFPMRFTQIRGELLSQVHDHYAVSSISPLITYRRNIEVVLDNKRYLHYKYCDCKKRMSSSCGGLTLHTMSVEFPYMCYVYVDHIEVDYSSVNDISVSIVCNGSEYILSSTCALAPTTCPDANTRDDYCNIDDDSILTKLVKNNSKKEPAVYCVVTFGEMFDFRLAKVRDVRIYGTAISFI